MIDSLKDFIAPKTFHIQSYVCHIVQFTCGLMLIAVTLELRKSEIGKFSCIVDTKSTLLYKTQVEKTCYSRYEQTYNSPLPLYAFVLLSVGLKVLVSVIYSLAVRNRVDDIDRTSNGSDEPNTDREEDLGFCVFYFYFFHLVVRSTFGMLFTALQHTVFYPGGFDFRFSCSYPKDATFLITTLKNASIARSNSTIVCENSTATEKQIWSVIVSLLSAFCAVVLLCEVIYLWRRFPIPHCRSEVGWSCDAEFVTVYLLRKRYLHVHELEITNMDNNIPDLNVQDCIDLYKQQVLQHSRSPDINYSPRTSLDDLYIDVVIHTGRAEHRFSKNMDRHQIHDVYMEVPEHSIRLEMIRDLFYPNQDTEGNFPRTILAVGRPGIGKTVLTEKIICDWANEIDELYCGKIAFLFKFRWFNVIDEFKNISLEAFLRFGTRLNEGQFESIFQEVLQEPEKAIFIFDGLDEFDGDLGNCLDQSRVLPNDPYFCITAINLFIKLVFGDLLPGATVLVTSRPTANRFYSKLNFDRSVEIIGFTSEKIKEYVDTFCDENNITELKPKIWNHIKSSSDLLNLCYIPVNCFIICVTLSGCLNDPARNDSGALPTTLTQLYQTAIDHFAEYHNRNVKKLSPELNNLQTLAFHDIENGQLVFNKQLFNEQMKKCGLVNSLSNPMFAIDTQYCFIHLTIQEFLAARHVTEMLSPDEIRNFIFSHIRSSKWHLVLLFISGLLGQKMKMFRSDYERCVLVLPEQLTVLSGEIDLEDYHNLFVMKCLREVDDEDAVRRACNTTASNLVTKISIFGHSFAGSDLAAVCFVCKCFNNLKHLLLANVLSIIGYHYLLEVGRALPRRCLDSLVVQESDSVSCSAMNDFFCELQKKCTLSHEHTQLKELNIEMLKSGQKWVSGICEVIKKGYARHLEKLIVSVQRIDIVGISQFSEVLNNDLCGKLTHLDFSLNDIGDEGVRMLCNALVQGNCKLTALELKKCSLTAKCVDRLSKLLRDEHSKLTELSLDYNDIGDEGVRILCESLDHNQCNLTKLSLVYCSLTAKCTDWSSEIIRNEHCKLTDLSLTRNDIGDEGVRMFCENALTKEHCKLTKLRLDKCHLTDQCVPLLCETLQDKNCDLTYLSLKLNEFTVNGRCLLLELVKLEDVTLDI